MFWLILQILIVFVSGGLSRDYNIYVSNHALNEQEDGSEERPFVKLNDALSEMKLKFLEYDRINILIAASETAYVLENESYNFDGKSNVSLTLSTWINKPEERQEKACINLSRGTLLNMSNLISMEMRRLDIVEQNASLIVRNSSSIFLEDMKLNLSNKENPLITVIDGLGLVMKRLDIKYRISSALVSYSFKKEAKLKQVFVEGILLTYLWSQEDFEYTFGLRERNPIFSIFGSDAYRRENLLNISKVEIEIKNGNQLQGSLKRLFDIERFDRVEISEVVANGQVLHQTRDRLFQIKDINFLELKKINFTNNRIITLAQDAVFFLDFLTNLNVSEMNFSGNKLDWETFTLIGVGSIHNATIEHHHIKNNSIQNDLELIRFMDYRPNDMSLVSTSLKISNITIADNKNELTTKHFTYISYLGSAFEELNVKDVDFYNNSISGRIFSFQSRPYRLGLGPKEIVPPRQLNFSHINVRNNPRIFDVNLIYFFSLTSGGSTNECLQLIEPYRLWIENLTVSDNAFAKGLNDLWMFEACLLEIQEAQVYLVNSEITNNYFEFYNFLSFDKKAATVALLGNRFINNTLNASQLVNTDFVSYDSACNVIREGTISPSKVFYRYSVVSNSSFSDIKVISGATLFAMNNNFLSFSENDLSQILLLNNSMFIKSKINVPKINLNPSAYIKDLSIEKLTLTPNNFNEDAFGQGISSWSLIENNFTDLTTDNVKFIELAGYGSVLSSQKIEGNRFLNVNFSSDASTASIFESDDLETGIYSENIFENISGKVCIFSISKSRDLRLLKVEGNNLLGGTVTSFVSFTGENAAILSIHGNSFRSMVLSEACLTINVKNAVGNWEFSENNFTNILLLISRSSVETDGYGLLSIYADRSSTNTEAWFCRNTFRNLSAQFSAKKNMEIKFYLLLIELNQRVIFEGNSFIGLQMNSQGSLLQLNYVYNLSIYDCTFRDIRFDSQTGLVSTSAREIRIINSTFVNVTNEGVTGIMVLLVEKLQNYFVDIQNLRIQGLTAQYENNSNNQLSALILDIKSFAGKGIFDYEIIQSVLLTLKAINCSIENLYQGAAFLLREITCKDCLVQDSRFLMTDEAAFTREVLYFSESVRGNFTLRNVTFPKHSTSQLSFIKIEFSLIDLRLENMYFSGDERGSSLVSLDSGALTMVNSIFENIVLDQAPFIYSVLRDQERFYDSFSPQFPVIMIENSTFLNMKKKFVPKSFPLLETLDYVYSSEEPIKVSSVIFCAIPAFVTVVNCTFSNFELVNAITFVDSVYQRESSRPLTFYPTVYVTGSLFADLKSNFGSAIMVNAIRSSPQVHILNSSFNRNFAYIGGVMSIYSGNLTIRNSSFFENHAAYMGAVIMRNEFSSERDIFEGLEFSRNKAQYGAEDPKGGKFIAFEATNSKLRFMTRNPHANRVAFASNSLFNVSTKDFTQSFLVMEFFDANGNPAPDLSANRKALFLVPHARKRDQTDVIGGSIIKQHDLYVHISLNEVAISGKAHEVVNITLEYSSDKLHFVHNISIHFRECLSGEYNNTVNCEVCSGLTYSFDPNISCTKCPANADCTVPGKVLPNKGFWNAHPQSDRIFACREDDIVRCPGDKLCADGYKGPLCNACDLDNSYVENGYLKCGKCTNPFKSLMFSILSVVLYAAYQLFSINAIYTGNSQISGAGIDYLTKRKIERSFYVKLLLTYTQLMSILYMASPEIAKSFGITSQIGDPVSLISHGTQCSMQALKIDPPNFLYSQILLNILSPVGQFGIIFVLILPLKLWKREKPIFKLLLVAVSYLIMSFQPGIVTSLTGFLSCSSIPGVDYPSYVTSHPYWSCESDPYPFYAQYVAKPSLIFWSILIPVAIFGILFMNRNNLQAPKLKMSLGVLYSDLKEKYYFWGIVLMAFKLILSPLAREIDKNSEVPVFLVLMLLWIYQAFLRKIKPYKTDKFNNFEIVLINLLIVNIILTRYLLNPENSSGINFITLALIIGANGGFLFVLGFKILSASWIQVIGFFERKVMKRNIARDPNFLLQDFDSIQVEKL